MKGINLEQFKSLMKTEEREQIEEKESYIRKLKKEIECKNQRIKELEQRFDVMTNRCYAQTLGTLCDFCVYRMDCKRYANETAEQTTGEYSDNPTV